MMHISGQVAGKTGSLSRQPPWGSAVKRRDDWAQAPEQREGPLPEPPVSPARWEYLSASLPSAVSRVP
jgi:hypothetical protein